MSGDLISRHAVVRILYELNMLKCSRTWDGMTPIDFITRLILEAESEIMALPSAEPEREKGE